jgi:carbamoylphosphate synthase large subunit
MKKAVISIAAGKNQLAIIKKAKELGYVVIGVDKDPGAIGFRYCDEIINLSTYDAEPIINNLKRFHNIYEIKGVLNRSSGIPALTTAEICKYLNILNVKPASAKTILDKSLLINFCNENNIPAPWNISINSLEDSALNELEFPCVVKPSFSVFGKLGVTKVEDKKSLLKALEQAFKYSSTGIVEIEEFIEGYDVTLMAVVHRGKVYVLTLLDEENNVSSNGEIYAKSYSVPSVFSGKKLEKDIYKLADELVVKLNIDTSMFLMSCRCKENTIPKLIEIHLDFGGDLVLDNLIPASTDFDILAYCISILSDTHQELPEISFKPAAVVYNRKSKNLDNSFSIMHAKSPAELDRLLKELESRC